MFYFIIFLSTLLTSKSSSSKVILFSIFFQISLLLQHNIFDTPAKGFVPRSGQLHDSSLPILSMGSFCPTLEYSHLIFISKRMMEAGVLS